MLGSDFPRNLSLTGDSLGTGITGGDQSGDDRRKAPPGAAAIHVVDDRL